MHTEYESQPVNAEGRLWKAVIYRAFDDIFYRGIEHTLVVAKKTAKSWFLKNSEDFKLVCMFASYEPEYIQDQFYKLKVKKEYEYTQPQITYLKQS
jgi:thiamine monophosphate kinase